MLWTKFQQGTQGKFVPSVFMLSCKRVRGEGYLFTFGGLFSKTLFHCFCLVLKQMTVLYGFFNVHFETNDQIFSEITE